jgi:hypothetical protein
MRRLKSLFALLAMALCTVAATAGGAAVALAQQRDDLIAARAYVQTSRAFSTAARAAALARIEAALRRQEPWTPAGFLVEMKALAALAENGHDFVHPRDGWMPERRLPLRLAWLADGLVVTRAAPAQARLVGRRVVAFDGHGLDAVLQALRRIDGGTDAYRRWNNGWLLEHPDLLHALGLARHPDRVTLDLRDAEGRVASVSVAAVPSAAVPHDGGRMGLWSRALSPAERAAGWTAAVRAPADPFWLQDPQRPFRLVELPALDALYVQFRGNLDGPGGESLEAFAADVVQRLQATPRRHVIVDQRLNRGGNADLTEDLMRAIGRRTAGRVYVLVGPETFSAGIVSAALLVHEAGERAVVVGDTVGDRLRWWSEAAPPVCLPHARYCLHGSTGLWDLVHGCAGEAGCYGDRFHAEVPGLVPALPAPLTVDDWIGGRDPALEAVRQDLARQGVPTARR